MKPSMISRVPLATACAALLAAASAQAHVTLAAGSATVGSHYAATFHVGHPCKDAATTTGITVTLPAGFRYQDAEARPGWHRAVAAHRVTWTADKAEAGIPHGQAADFIIHGQLPARPGTVWFKVLQRCDVGQADWAGLPDASGAKPEFPAVRLDIVAKGVPPPTGAGVAEHPPVH